ncbi:hypothetical protein EZS27_036214 [termite gut metagenome]|uniref:Transposase IS110-like N-terminal domain-containing protein n=1 Tax=termite gut metagenome TaxID=433724 RepID=A0A5J4PX84_9ZZZZ
MKKIIMGMDVSEQRIDVCVLSGDDILLEQGISNTISPIESFLQRFFKKHSFSVEDVLVCAEYTGTYTCPLCLSCREVEVDLWLENPYPIKHSSDLHHGKNDRLDAKKIARYACRFEDKACLFVMSEQAAITLRALISERELYMESMNNYLTLLTDEKEFMNPKNCRDKNERLKRLLERHNEAIKQVESHIQRIIDRDETLSRRHQLLCSIDEVGEQTESKDVCGDTK